MLENGSKRERIIAAALKLAEAGKWSSVTLADIADEAGVSLSALHSRFRSKTAILEGFVDMVDGEVLRKAKAPDMDSPARDRVFEVLMTRFDILAPYKTALANIRRSYACAPQSGAARLLCASANSQKWMLTAAGIPSDGGKGCVRVSGMVCLYGKVAPVWLKDDDPDLAKTMAALDRELRNGERWLKRLDALVCDLGRIACCFVPRRRKRRSEDTPVEPNGLNGGTAPAAEQPSGG